MKMKYTSRLLILTLLITLLFTLTSCYTPLKREKLDGTYELTLLTTKYNDGRVVDRIEKYGAEKYIIIKSDDTGYFVEKSNDEFYVRELKLEFTRNDDGKCTHVKYTDGKGENNSLSIHSTDQNPYLKDVYIALGSFKTTWEYTKYTKDASLEKLSEKLGIELKCVTFDQYAFDGIYVRDSFTQETGDMIYDFYYLHTDTLKVVRYIKYTDGETDVIESEAQEDGESFTIDGIKLLKRGEAGMQYNYLETEEQKTWNFYGVSVKDVMSQFEEQYEEYYAPQPQAENE